MSAAPPSSPSWSLCSLQGSLLTLAIITVLSLLQLSYKSLNSPLHSSDTSLFQISPSYESFSTTEDVDSEIFKEDVLSDVYHLPEVFKLNFEAMERDFKVYIYPDGDPNTFYQTPRKLTGKYASEGFFFQNIRESHFRTEDPDQADLFFIPISCHKMRGKVHSLDFGIRVL